MFSTQEQIDALKTRIDAIAAAVVGNSQPGLLYALVGSHVVFGCKVTAPGLTGLGMVLALDGQAAGDAAHLNPDLNATPARPEEYPNIANVYGQVLLLANKNKTALQDAALTVGTAPGTGYHRYDIVYCYVGTAGPAVAIAAGTPVANASTPADPSLPQGVLPLARVHVQAGVTSITSGDITDLRTFTGRLRGEQGPIGVTGLTGPAGATGPTGPAGVSAGLNYAWSTATTGDPGAGKVLANNANYASVTQINISETDANGASMIAVLARWGASTTATDKGVLRVVDVANKSNYIELKIVAAPTDAGTYLTVPVAHLASNGTIANATSVSVQFERSGDKGADGVGAGDVVGPASSTNNSLARFDGTTGRLLKDGAVIGVDVQAQLVSGTNIKSINGQTVLGSGDLVVNSGLSLADAYILNSAMLGGR